LPREGVKRILIRGTNWIGDAVMGLAALAAIRNTYPQARLSILAKPWVADIYRLTPAIDEVILYERPGVHAGIRGLWRLARELKGRHFDLAILLQNAIEAAVIVRLAGIPLRAGYASDARGFLLTHGIKKTQASNKVHQVRYYLEMVRALGCEEIRPGPLLALSPEGEREADRLFAEQELDPGAGVVGFAPGAAYGPAKKWFPERYAALADRLKKDFSLGTMLLGSKGDRDTVQAIQGAASLPHADLTGKTDLATAVSLIARCRLFITNDSGLMHIAGALQVPTLAIFGSTNPQTTSPLGEKSVVLYKGVACSPCLRETCPTDFRCMDLIGVDEVYERAKGLLCRR